MKEKQEGMEPIYTNSSMYYCNNKFEQHFIEVSKA